MAGSTVAELFRLQGRRVRSFLRRRLRSPEDAQDAAQDVFLNLLRREQAGALDTDARAYMSKTMHTTAIDVQRWRAYHRPQDLLPLEENAVGPDETDVDEVLYWREALRRFVESLNELPDVTQQVFVLYHVEGQPHTKIARRLSISVRSVERHMARAIEHCEARLKEYLG